MNRQIQRFQIDRKKIDEQVDTKKVRYIDKKIDEQIDKKKVRYIDKKIDEQIDKKIDEQIDTKKVRQMGWLVEYWSILLGASFTFYPAQAQTKRNTLGIKECIRQCLAYQE